MSFRRVYGASVWHLIGHLVAIAVAAFALEEIFSRGPLKDLLFWFIGLSLLHDLVFIPLYTGFDRLVRAAVARLPERPRRHRTVPIVNYIRAPALISGVLLLIYSPFIFGQAERLYLAYAGHRLEGYVRNWLLITLALFLASGLLYAIRVWRHAGR